MKTIIITIACIMSWGCAPMTVQTGRPVPGPATLIKKGEAIAIMPFETESILSNLGNQLADELVVNLVQHAPDLKIVPGSVVHSKLLEAGQAVSGLPDIHAIHAVQSGTRCRYMLTGNFYTSIGDVRYTTTYTNRLATGSLTLRLIDCDSLTVIWAAHVEGSYSTSLYYIGSGEPTSYRSDGELLVELMKDIAAKAARYFY